MGQYSFSKIFSRKNLSLIDWNLLLINPHVSFDFFNSHSDFINPLIFLNEGLEYDQIMFLAKKANLELDEVIDYENPLFCKVSPYGIAKYECDNKLKPLIEEGYIRQIDFSKVIISDDEDLELLRKYKRDVDWYALSSNPTIPVDFFEENLFRLNIYNLSANPSIPAEFFLKHGVDYTGICTNPNIDFKYLTDKGTFYKGNLIINYDPISETFSPNLEIWFCKKYPERIDLQILSANPNIPAKAFSQLDYDNNFTRTLYLGDCIESFKILKIDF